MKDRGLNGLNDEDPYDAGWIEGEDVIEYREEAEVASFMRADETEAAWSVIMPILEVWESMKITDFSNYQAGGTCGRKRPMSSLPRTDSAGSFIPFFAVEKGLAV